MTAASVIVLLTALLVSASAQEPTADPGDCPEGFACVEYQGHTLEIDRRYGAVCFVTRVETIRTATLDGIKETKEAYCTEFEESGDTYVPEDHEQRLEPRQAAVADPGASLVDRFVEPQ